MTTEAGLQPSRNLAPKQLNTTYFKSEPKTKQNATKPQAQKRPKRCLRNPKKEKIAASVTNLQAAGKTCPIKQQPSRNLAGTKTKMKLVGRRPETAKHHLNPSPKRIKTLRNRKQKTLQTLPTEPKKKKKKKK